MKTLFTTKNQFLKIAFICLLMSICSASNAQSILSKSIFLFDSFFQKTENRTESNNSETDDLSSKILIFEESLLKIKSLFYNKQDTTKINRYEKVNKKFIPKEDKNQKSKSNNRKSNKKKFRNCPGNHEIRI